MDVYGRLISATNWSFSYIDSLTLPDNVYPLFEYWKKCPPVSELTIITSGWQAPVTMEEAIKQGAMGPMEFLEHFKKTKGKVRTE